MAKIEYTAKLHVKRLHEMFTSLKGDEISYSCPACEHFNAALLSITGDDENSAECRICQDFVDIPPGTTEECPCDYYGCDEAIKITIKKLKEEGFPL